MTQKNKFTLLATALMIGASSLSASGQTSRQAFGTGDLPEFLKAYDLDGDGKLSVEERQAFEKASRSPTRVPGNYQKSVPPRRPVKSWGGPFMEDRLSPLKPSGWLMRRR